jgi:hypothetical protein
MSTHSEPTELFHYTTIRGLLGILRDGVIFATDCRFVNDEQELKHGLESIALPHLEKQREDQDDFYVNFLVSLIRGDRERTDTQPYGVTPYIACFSEKGDQLSQWRGYGAEVGAVALGFSLTLLRDALSTSNPQMGAHLLKVLYKADEQSELFDRVFPPRSGKPWLSGPRAGGEWIMDISTAAITCKHSKFEEEEEWRIAVPNRSGSGRRAAPHQPDDFRVDGKFIAPYIKVSLRTADGRLPLTRVICAPGDPEIAQAGVTSVLEKFGYDIDAVVVEKSMIPYRH